MTKDEMKNLIAAVITDTATEEVFLDILSATGLWYELYLQACEEGWDWTLLTFLYYSRDWTLYSTGRISTMEDGGVLTENLPLIDAIVEIFEINDITPAKLYPVTADK